MMTRARIPTAGARGALTVLEVLLTLCLLVVLASLAIPAVSRPLAGYRLRKAAEQIRVEWGRARVDAMYSGITHVFRSCAGDNRYWIERQTGCDAATDAISNTGSDRAAQEANPSHRVPHSLPEGVRFAADRPSSQAESQTADSVADRSILFFPDGTTSTVRLTLRNQHDRCIEVALRGLTGMATVGEPYAAEE